jgi:predicted nuclease with RNAse H fold
VIAAGIDLSGRRVGTTAVAWVGGDPGDRRPHVKRVEAGARFRGDRGDAEICDAVLEAGVVAIDAPLTLPHAITCTDDQCERCFPAGGVAPSYGRRDELDGPPAWAAVGHAGKPPMPTVMLAGIAFRGIYLRRLLGRAGLAVIEVWPMGAYRAIARSLRTSPASDPNDGWRRALLGEMVDDLDGRCGAGGAAERDRLDAVAAAYVGWCWLADRARPVPVGTARDGDAIWIPAA